MTYYAPVNHSELNELHACIVSLTSFTILVFYSRLMVEVEKHPTLIVIGETGSGKTTQIPQFIVEQEIGGNGMIAVTQVRRKYQIIYWLQFKF